MKHHNITRYNNTFKGWRLALTRCSVNIQMYFPDHAYEGSDGALKAALRHRDLLLAEWVQAKQRGEGNLAFFIQLKEKYNIGRKKVDK